MILSPEVLPHLPTNPLDSHFRFRCCDGENLKYDSRLDNYQRKQRVMQDLFISVRKMVLKTFTIVHHYDANTNIVSSYGLISKIGAALSSKGGKYILSRSSPSTLQVKSPMVSHDCLQVIFMLICEQKEDDHSFTGKSIIFEPNRSVWMHSFQ